MQHIATVNKFLLVARFLLILLPQNGYIHPDEFFQSSEVTASDIFGTSISRTWEWNAKSPTRTILFPYLSSGIPFMVAKLWNSLFGIEVTTTTLLILPRIFIATGTYLIDKAIRFLAGKVYKTGPGDKDCQEGVETALFLFRSSAVTLVFLARTFSNVCETIIFSLFLWKAVSQISKKDFNDGLGSTTVLLTLMATFGFFIRPTLIFFVAFGSIAYVFICFRNGKILSQALLAGLTLIITSFSIICLDSMYFSQGEQFKFSITPLNMIKYNLDEANLQMHGEHPRYLHFLVNLPLLFGPLVLMFSFASYLLFRKPRNSPAGSEIPINKGAASLLVASAWSAVLPLSYFKHQEPRFIIPIITPVCLISPWFLARYPGAWRRFLHFWLIFNSALVAWFGFVHQGGIVPCLSHLREKIRMDLKTEGIKCVKYDVIFWYTYMAPKHLINVGTNRSLADVTVHNLGGKSEKDVKSLIKELSDQSKNYHLKKCKNLVSDI